jgi:signal transduction histidine kinase
LRTWSSNGERFKTKGVTLTTELPAGVGKVLADRDRPGQVLGNLLDNALRRTGTGGTVMVRARVSHESDVARLVVDDNGDGIPAEPPAHIFERFYRATFTISLRR